MNAQNRFRPWARVLGALTFAWSLLGTVNVSRAVPNDFIYRDGVKLMLNGQQYKFAGINADTWFGCWSSEVPSDAQLDRFFRELNPRSMTRVWVMPGSDLSIMDRIVAKADQYNQYLAPVLGNGNADCDSIGSKSAAWYESGFRGTYLSHVRTVVTRYKDSRAIGFWEMINEPKGSDPNLKNFYRDTSDLIKSIDLNHLVGSGSHAAWSSGNTSTYTDQHNLPNVDLISVHEYDDRDFHWADQAQIAARQLNKPFYVGEDGFCCGGGPGPTNWTANAPVLVAEYDAYLKYPECAGLMYWDFKLGYPGPGETINFGDGGWDVLRTYANPYRGGPSGTQVPPSSTAVPAAPSGLSGSLTTDTRVKLSWADNAGDETGYEIERRARGIGAYASIATLAANSTSYQDPGTFAANTTYFYRVRARNANGASGYSNVALITTGSAVNTTIDDNNLGSGQNQFEYSGTWQYWTGDSAKYQGDDHYSSTANAYANFRFTGTGVRFYAKTAPHHGIVALSIDGGAETNIDLYAPNGADQVLLYTSSALASAPHTLKLRVTGTKNASSDGTTITIDKVDVIQSAGSASAVAPTNLVASAVSASQTVLSWIYNASDESGFKIERKNGVAGAYAQVAVTSADVTTYQDLNLTPGTYYYRVRAGTSAGDSAYSNEAAATTANSLATTINDNTTGTGLGQFEYGGTWSYWSGTASKYQGDDHYSGETNAQANLRFSGTGVRYYAKKARHHGIVAVSIDAGQEALIDLYASAADVADQVLVYTSPTLAAGPHALRIRVTGSKNASSGATIVTVDRVEISP